MIAMSIAMPYMQGLGGGVNWLMARPNFKCCR